MIEIDGVKRQVYVKLTDKDYMLSIINGTVGRGEYKHTTGEIFIVEVVVVRMGYKKIRVENLPPEVLDDALRTSLAPFGQGLEFKTRCGRGTTGIQSLTAFGKYPCFSHNMYCRILWSLNIECSYLMKVNTPLVMDAATLAIFTRHATGGKERRTYHPQRTRDMRRLRRSSPLPRNNHGTTCKAKEIPQSNV